MEELPDLSTRTHPEKDALIHVLSAMVQSLAPRVDTLTADVAELNGRLDALRSMLDILPSSRFLLGPQGTVMVMNAAGKAMLDARDGLLLDGGILCAVRASDRAGLQRTIDAALAGDTDAAREPLLLRRNSGRRPYAVFIVPPKTRAPAFASAGKMAALTAVDLDRALAIPPTVFRAEFGLSRAESLLAARLIAGENLVEAANGMKINVSTVRLHLEHVFLKTGVHRQGELISLLLGPFVDLPVP